MPFTLEDLGSNIRKIRESRESKIKPGKPLLQYELARISQIPASSLSNIEKGKYRNPTWSILSKIAAGLDCDISDLFFTERKQISPAEFAFREMIDLIVREKLEDVLKKRA
ncbi:MAG: helix-turn-helix transcriptional regulator [Candidatus Aminicenantales bacterium]